MAFPEDSSSSDPSSSDTSPSVSPTLSASPLATPSTAISQPEPEPIRFDVFHVEAPRTHHKIFISTGPPPAAGFFIHVLFINGLAQPMMILMNDPITSVEQLTTIHDSMLIGSIAAHDLNRLHLLIQIFGVPFCPISSDPPNEHLRRAERWVRTLTRVLLEDGILQAPPPPPRPHQLPRHHHTAHCIHQRLHSHHPYRRRGRRPFVNRSPGSRNN